MFFHQCSKSLEEFLAFNYIRTDSLLIIRIILQHSDSKSNKVICSKVSWEWRKQQHSRDTLPYKFLSSCRLLDDLELRWTCTKFSFSTISMNVFRFCKTCIISISSTIFYETHIIYFYYNIHHAFDLGGFTANHH